MRERYRPARVPSLTDETVKNKQRLFLLVLAIVTSGVSYALVDSIKSSVLIAIAVAILYICLRRFIYEYLHTAMNMQSVTSWIIKGSSSGIILKAAILVLGPVILIWLILAIIKILF